MRFVSAGAMFILMAYRGTSVHAQDRPGPSPASQPGIVESPTSADLLRELRELRATLQDQQRRHEAEIGRLQAQIDALRMAGQPAPGAQPSGPAPAASAPAAPPGSSPEDELQALISGATAATPTPSASQPMSLAGRIGAAVQSFNPDISLNGDFLAAYSNREGGQLDDEFLFRELEVAFGGAVDPYTRADAIITLGHENNHEDIKAEIEEAYLTFLKMPYDLQARVGRFRADLGRANSTHLHSLPWTDYPFVIKRSFGPEGLFGTGAELSWLVPNPGKQYVNLTYEVFNNDNDTLFAGQKSDDFTHLVHLKTFRDLSPTWTLELGGSFATAPNDEGHGDRRSTVEGFDMTYKWKPKDRGLYQSLLWQSEVLFTQAEIIGGTEKTWGMYSAVDYQFARRWKFGLRYDNTQLPFSSSLHERGYSAYLTFLQSEFVFWRLGYLYTDRNFAQDGNYDEQQLFLQLNWSLGTHPAHKY